MCLSSRCSGKRSNMLHCAKQTARMVEDISALGLRHVGYAIPTDCLQDALVGLPAKRFRYELTHRQELFAPFVSCFVETAWTFGARFTGCCGPLRSKSSPPTLLATGKCRVQCFTRPCPPCFVRSGSRPRRFPLVFDPDLQDVGAHHPRGLHRGYEGSEHQLGEAASEGHRSGTSRETSGAPDWQDKADRCAEVMFYHVLQGVTAFFRVFCLPPD